MKLSVSKIGLIAGAAFAGIAIAAEDAPPEHIQWMKDLNNQNGAIRKGVDVEKNAAAMVETMKHVQAFWAKRSSDVAAKASNDTIEGATQIAKANGDKEALTAGMKLVGAGCRNCHTQHREKVSETESKIK
jgi:cytochrome c556